MMIILVIAAILSGVPSSAAGAITAFNGGELYLRTTGMEPGGDFSRNSATGILSCTGGFEGARWRYLELELWNTTMLTLWNSVNTSETNFTIRAGEEYLLYDNFLLLYTNTNTRAGICIHPEELWAILNHLGRNPSAATSQIALSGWYPGLPETENAFVSAYDPVYEVIQELLERGREATPLE